MFAPEGESDISQTEVTAKKPAGGGFGTAVPAFLVAAGILLSRITGLIRESVFAHYFGNSASADAYKAAFRIPNFLQTLFGEGVLSASFIPVYASLLARGDEKEARKVAGAIFTMLFFFVSLLVLIGVIAAPYLIDLIAPGFSGERRVLTVQLVRIFFPGIGLLVLSAWCLGILNSHRKFFMSYAAPVAMNAAIISTLIAFGRRYQLDDLASVVAWGSVVGCGLQLGVQLPSVVKLLRGFPLVFNYALENVRTVVRNFLPVFVSRGVVQVSAYVDQLLASLLPIGAIAALAYAQLLALLPVSLFGMSVSAAELPAMSSVIGAEEEVANQLRTRLNYGLRQIAYFVVPSAMAFLAVGDVVNAAVFQSGRFGRQDAMYVWGILAGSSVGLLATTMGRLYSSTYYALRDTRTPLRFAIVRVVLTSALGYLAAIPLPPLLGLNPRWGVAGLTASAGVAGWVEFTLLRWGLNKRIGRTGLKAKFAAQLWGSAAVAGAIGFAIKLGLGHRNPRLMAVAVLVPYGLVYFAATWMLGMGEATVLVKRVSRIIKK